MDKNTNKIHNQKSHKILGTDKDFHIPVSLFTLNFPEELEKEYSYEYLKRYLFRFRLYMILGSLLYMSFSILDSILLPHLFSQYIIIRAFVSAVLFINALLSFTPGFLRYIQILLFITIMLSSLGLLSIIVIATFPATMLYSAGFLLIIMFGYTMPYARFIWASLCGWLIFITNIISFNFIMEQSFDIQFTYYFLLGGANIIGMLLAYFFEYSSRRNFYIARKLSELENANRKLKANIEYKVMERTKEFENLNKDLIWEINYRKEIEELLRNSEENLITLVKKSSMAMFISNEYKNIELINDKFTEIFGYHEDDIPTITAWQELAYPDYEYRLIVRKAWTKAKLEAEQSGSYVRALTWKVRCKTGQVKDIEFHYASIGPKALVLLNDVTEGRNAIEALRESENKYRTLYESSPDAILLIKEEAIIDCNSKTLDIFGGSRDDIVGQNIVDLSSSQMPNAKDTILKMRRVLMEVNGGNPHIFEWSPKRKSGEAFVAEVNLRKISGLESNVFLAIVRDITNRKKVERELKESQQKYKSIFENILDVYFNIGIDGNIKNISPSGARLLGYDSAAEMIRKHIASDLFVDKADNDIYMNEVLETGGTKNYPLQLKKQDGSVVYVEVNSRLQLDSANQPVGIEGMLRDITKRMQMEEALRESEKIYRHIFQNAQVALFRQDIQKRRIIKGNDQFAGIFGFGSISDATETEFDFTDKFNDPDIKEHFIEILNEDNEVNGFEAEFQKDESSTIWMRISARLSDNKTWIDVVAQDISEYKLAQQVIQNLNRDLEDRVNKKTSELRNTLIKLTYENEERRKMQEKLAEAKQNVEKALLKEKNLSELKTKFIAMISHEYRTPLTVISASTYLLTKMFEINDRGQFESQIKKIGEAVNEMNYLLEQVLTFGRTESAAMAHSPSRIELISTLQNIIDKHLLIDKDQHEIDLVNAENEVVIVNYKDAFIQIINNLLTNALKFSPSGTPVTITLHINNEYITIGISDKGIGISPNDIERLFDPFFRSGNVGNISGVGLGLAIVKQNINAMGGQIEVSSKIKEGSTFTITLPKKFNSDDKE